MVLKNITRLQQQQEQCKNDSSNHYQFDDNVASSADVNNVTQRLKTLSTNSEEPNMEHCSNSKSRLQMRAPPPLSNLPSTNISDASYTGSSILSPCSSNQGGSGVEFGSNNSSWLANSNGLDSLLHHKHLTMCNNDPSKFDDDLPSLLAKQGLAKYTDLFLRHEIDIQTFSTLTEQDLKEIGITTFGARKKLLYISNEIKQILMAQNSSTTSANVHQWLQD